MDKHNINKAALHTHSENTSESNHLIYVTHGEYQEEVVNLNGRKFFPFSFALLIFILAYKNSVSRITGIQNSL